MKAFLGQHSVGYIVFHFGIIYYFCISQESNFYGTIGERRHATPSEIERGNRRLGRMKTLPGGKKLFGNMGFEREVHFHAFEEAKLLV